MVFTRVFNCCETTPLKCALVFHTRVRVLWNNSPDMCPCFSHACPSAVKQLFWYVPLCFTRLSVCCETTPLICSLVFHTRVRVLWNNSPDMCPWVSDACSSAIKQIQGVVGVVVSVRAGNDIKPLAPAHYLVEAQRRQVGTCQVGVVSPPSLSLSDWLCLLSLLLILAPSPHRLTPASSPGSSFGEWERRKKAWGWD